MNEYRKKKILTKPTTIISIGMTKFQWKRLAINGCRKYLQIINVAIQLADNKTVILLAFGICQKKRSQVLMNSFGIDSK